MVDKHYKEEFERITARIDASISLQGLEATLLEETPKIRDEGAKGFFHKTIKKLSEFNVASEQEQNILNLVRNFSKSDVLNEKCDNALEFNS